MCNVKLWISEYCARVVRVTGMVSNSHCYTVRVRSTPRRAARWKHIALLLEINQRKTLPRAILKSLISLKTLLRVPTAQMNISNGEIKAIMEDIHHASDVMHQERNRKEKNYGASCCKNRMPLLLNYQSMYGRPCCTLF